VLRPSACLTPFPPNQEKSTQRAGEGGGNSPAGKQTQPPFGAAARGAAPGAPTPSILNAVGQGRLRRTRHRCRPRRCEPAPSAARGAKRKPCFRQKAAPAAPMGEIHAEETPWHRRGWTGGPGPRARPCRRHREAPRPAAGRSPSTSTPQVTPKANGVGYFWGFFPGFIPPAAHPSAMPRSPGRDAKRAPSWPPRSEVPVPSSQTWTGLQLPARRQRCRPGTTPSGAGGMPSRTLTARLPPIPRAEADRIPSGFNHLNYLRGTEPWRGEDAPAAHPPHPKNPT